MTTGFREHVGLQVGSEDKDRATLELMAADEHLNPHGTVHGGVLATMCDVAMGIALAAEETTAPVTVEMKVVFLQPGHKGRLQAEAVVRKRGKRILVAEAEVTQEGETIALASATFTDVGPS